MRLESAGGRIQYQISTGFDTSFTVRRSIEKTSLRVVADGFGILRSRRRQFRIESARKTFNRFAVEKPTAADTLGSLSCCFDSQ